MISTRNGRLCCYMNLMALDSLPPSSSGPRHLTFEARAEAMQKAGFDGVQFAHLATKEELAVCHRLGLGVAASGRINVSKEAPALAEQLASDGYGCATLHVGWGIENDDEAECLIGSVLSASERWRIPLYIETHRATIFQDMWRTVAFVNRYPSLQINGDFSHWYTGQEMVYGDFEMKFAFIHPVLERVRFLHGRIGTPGCMQVRIDPDFGDGPPYVRHFKQLWTACFRYFRLRAAANDCIYFTPELLGPEIFYARAFPNADGKLIEESDRWQQSLVLKRIAQHCFEGALQA